MKKIGNSESPRMIISSTDNQQNLIKEKISRKLYYIQKTNQINPMIKGSFYLLATRVTNK